MPMFRLTRFLKRRAMTKLQRLFAEQRQSPWLDNLTRRYLLDGELSTLVENGIRGVTANPTVISRAILLSPADYDGQIARLLVAGYASEAVIWELAIADVTNALEVLRPVFDASGGTDGFVSLQVPPKLARDTEATIRAARLFHERIDRPNLMVKIPATAEGIPAIRAMVAEGRNINVTLIFSLPRYAEVIDAYISGLETFARNGGNVSDVLGVASFFVSRVDREVGKRLESLDADFGAGSSAGVAQARLAYRMFVETVSSDRWAALAAQGAHPQKLLWASTSNKDPATPDTRYVDELIGPDTVTTLPETMIRVFEDHGTLRRTIDEDLDKASDLLERLAEAGIDMPEVGEHLVAEGVAAFQGALDSAWDYVAGVARSLRVLSRTGS